MNGVVLQGGSTARDFRMHLAVYQNKPDISAVVHAHPARATALSMSKNINEEQLNIALPEVLFNLKGSAETNYCTQIHGEVTLELVTAS